MSQTPNQNRPPIEADDLTLLAFGELPAEQAERVQRLLVQDRKTRAAVDAMRRLARAEFDDSTGPSEELLAAAGATIRVALARRRRWRRVRVVAALGSAAAAVAVIAVISRTPAPTENLTVAKAQATPASHPDATRLTDADRQAIQQTIVRMWHEQTWDDPLDEQTVRLRRRIEHARSVAPHVSASQGRYLLLRRQIDRLSKDIAVEPQTTRPAGSTKSPVPGKESDHA